MSCVLEIIRDHLREKGYDGLFNSDAGCACVTDDLEPCGEMSSECEPGHLAPCDCGEHEWHIVRDNLPAKEKE